VQVHIVKVATKFED